MLKVFKEMQLKFDHGYFKNFVCEFIDLEEILQKGRSVDKRYDIEGMSSCDQIVE